MVGVVGLEGEKDGKRVLGAEEGKCVVGEKVTDGLTEGVGEGVMGALVSFTFQRQRRTMPSRGRVGVDRARGSGRVLN